MGHNKFNSIFYLLPAKIFDACISLITEETVNGLVKLRIWHTKEHREQYDRPPDNDSNAITVRKCFCQEF